jgi:hypothetical protein
VPRKDVPERLQVELLPSDITGVEKQVIADLLGKQVSRARRISNRAGSSIAVPLAAA